MLASSLNFSLIIIKTYMYYLCIIMKSEKWKEEEEEEEEETHKRKWIVESWQNSCKL